MTEEQWRACTDPGAMLTFLGRRVSQRKARLFAVACLRRLAHLLDGPNADAVAAAESHADGSLGDEALADAAQVAREANAPRFGFQSRSERAVRDALAFAVEVTTARTIDVLNPFVTRDHFGAANLPMLVAGVVGCGWGAPPPEPDKGPGDPSQVSAAEAAAQAGLLRCVFGSPFRAVWFDPVLRQWNGGTAVALAQAMYDNGDFSQAALLADMLEEGGATDPLLLKHLRGPGPHARGCFALDFVLGRE